MPQTIGQSYTFSDLSSTTPIPPPAPGTNPFIPLIALCEDEPQKITARYEAHRTARLKQQRELLLSPTFEGPLIDPILRGILSDPYHVDPRHNLPLWARPTKSVRSLIAHCQAKLAEVAPSMWMMPLERLHLTTLEMAHSRSEAEIQAIVDQLEAGEGVKGLTDFTFRSPNRARLVRPLLGFDAAAVALSFVPDKSSRWGYHHLRRDLWEVANAASKVDSRYIVPSAHLTIARFVTAKDLTEDGGEDGLIDRGKVAEYVRVIDQLNEWMQDTLWKADDQGANMGGVWVVGEGKGLDLRKGPCWYGGGESVRVGQGL